MYVALVGREDVTLRTRRGTPKTASLRRPMPNITNDPLSRLWNAAPRTSASSSQGISP